MSTSGRTTASLALLFVLLAVTAGVFASGLRGGFVYDDYYLVETNPALRDPGGWARFLTTSLFEGADASGDRAWAEGASRYYRPVVKLALLLQYRAFGLDAHGYHVTSLILHLACVLLAAAWLRRRLDIGSLSSGSIAAWRVLGPAAVALALFAWHPTRVEAVSWISGSADLWMTFWVLCGLLCLGESVVRHAGACLCIALAVLSKEVAVVVPFCVFADAALNSPGAPASRLRRRQAGALLGTVAAVVALRLVFVPLPTGGAAEGWSAARGVAAWGAYVARVVWPWHPSTQIGLIDAGGTFDLSAWHFGTGIAALVALVAWILVARRRAPWRPGLADAAWFVLPLLPVLNVAPLGYTMLIGERFLYLPLLGIAALLGRGLVAASPRVMSIGVGATFAFAIASAVASYAYVPHLASNVSLWSYEVQSNRRSPYLHLYLARAFWAANDLAAAQEAARIAHDLAAHPDTRAETAVVWASVRLQDAGGGETQALERLRVFFDDVASGRPAVLELDGARLEADPSAPVRERLSRTTAFRSSRAVAHARTLHLDSAETLLRALAPEDRTPATVANLVRVLALQGRWPASVAAADDALRRHPRDASLAQLRQLVVQGSALPAERSTARDARLARIYLALGSSAMARRIVESATAPQDPALVVVSALADATDGDVSRARERLRDARQHDPEHAASWDAASRELEALVSPQKADLEGLFR